jgi:hypothetical protein
MHPTHLKVLIYVCHMVLILPIAPSLQIRAELELRSPHVARGFRQTGHEIWTDLLNNPQSHWFSHSDDSSS